jgi:DNA mismatch repair protein MutL
MGKIAILPPDEARKIAAGEVIDRPAALVREFLDNALDSGCSLAETIIEEGGIRRVEVIDDGSGMEKEDLELCWETHATSKIRSLEDLNTAETLGFRGEALAAAAAVSRLEILSSVDGREAWLLEAGPGSRGIQVTQARRVRGSSVRSIGLFDTIPARKRFLKREGAEAALCRQVFTEKALAFPAVSFRLTQDGKLKCFYPAAASLKERFSQAIPEANRTVFLHEINAVGQGFSVVIVFGRPELYRQDRRQQYIFANGRRVQDYSLLQAFEYGLQHWFPNGVHPVGAVYIDIDPALADFNVHPAKREARFHDSGAIHHAITSALSEYAKRAFIAADRSSGNTGGSDTAPAGPWLSGGRGGGEAGNSDTTESGAGTPFWFVRQNGGLSGNRDSGAGGRLALEALLDHPPDFAPLPRQGLTVREAEPAYGEDAAGTSRMVGRLFTLFILIERGDRLYIIDQHAAHERILYDRCLAGRVTTQELLVPIPFTTDSVTADSFLAGCREGLKKLGVCIEEEGGAWRITALPANWKLSDSETVKAIVELETAGENMAERWAATMACHSAVKDGDWLDDGTALALAEAALDLPLPRCPHGRPIWKEIGREELFRAVRRIE